MVRLLVALSAILFLGLMAARTLSDERVRLATMVVLGFFAIRIVIAHKMKTRSTNPEPREKL
jgi:hypothetical protein